MSEEPQPLRLKPRPPAGDGTPSPPDAPAAPPPAPDAGEGTARLRLKPRLNLAEDPLANPLQGAAEPEAFIPPPASYPAPSPGESSAETLPVIKLRPKGAPSAPPPPAFNPSPSAPPPPPAFGDMAPPEPPGYGDAPPPPDSPPPPPRSSGTMPPMSVLSAPPPPAPGAMPEPPAAPGTVPRLSMPSLGAPPPPPPPMKAGLNIKVSGDPAPKGGKPPAVRPGKPPKMGAVLKKRAALGPVAKVGIGVVVVAIAVAGVFFYRIFFPTPQVEVPKKPQPVVVQAVKDTKEAAAAAEAKAAAAKLADALAAKHATEQQKVDAATASQEVPTPTPATESVMAQTTLSTDVKVNNTHLDAAPAASPSFRAFVASAGIGGVFQGSPARALINGTIVREGQLVDSALGIAFERIDSANKMIYFKDSTGAEVSKNY